MKRFATALVCMALRALSIMKYSSTHDVTLSFPRFELPEKEVEARGSYCINGALPVYYFRKRSQEGKWIFWLGSGHPCADEEGCAEKVATEDAVREEEPIHGDVPLLHHKTFANYNAVYIHNCDYGLYLGNRSKPLVLSDGTNMYARGARILQHIVDKFKNDYTMNQVLLGGASGGGNAAYIVAEKFKKMLPDTVTKFAVVPINGWFGSLPDNLLTMSILHGMKSTVPSCVKAFSQAERHLCLDPPTAYRYQISPTFIVQEFDKTFKYSQYAKSTPEFRSAWEACLHCRKTSNETCTNKGVNLLKSVWNNFTWHLKSYPQFGERTSGGYISTCPTHTWWRRYDAMVQQKTDGATLGAAVSKWWLSIGSDTSAKRWYLPCQLGSVDNTQCESTCWDDDLHC